jgi:hypothetical protein
MSVRELTSEQLAAIRWYASGAWISRLDELIHSVGDCGILADCRSASELEAFGMLIHLERRVSSAAE